MLEKLLGMQNRHYQYIKLFKIQQSVVSVLLCLCVIIFSFQECKLCRSSFRGHFWGLRAYGHFIWWYNHKMLNLVMVDNLLIIAWTFCPWWDPRFSIFGQISINPPTFHNIILSIFMIQFCCIEIVFAFLFSSPAFDADALEFLLLRRLWRQIMTPASESLQQVMLELYRNFF